MSKLSSIFICYRREDSSGYAGRIYDGLSSRFDPEQIFMDLDKIEPGLDFVEVIESAVGACDAMVVVIGTQWLNSKDAQGERRLENPEDVVRLEIATAIARNIRVIPVLVQGAVMPRSSDLPEPLAKLARRNALEMSDARWKYDIEKLGETLKAVLEAAKSKAPTVLAKTATAPAKPTAAPPPSARRRWDRAGDAELPVEVSDDERHLHNDARRFARLLVSEIKVYNQQKVREGLLKGNIYEQLRDDIDRSRQMYEKRIARQVAARYDYFDHELIITLAEGDATKMGKGYPGIILSK